MLVQLAQMASTGIETIELLAREHAARLRAEALQRVGAAITARLDLHAIVQVATDAATDLTRAQFGSFFYNVHDPSGEMYTLYTLSGVPASAFAGFPMPRNTRVFVPTFAGEGIVRLDDITADARCGHNAPYNGMPRGHLPVRSYLAVPVRLSDGTVAGGLLFGHPEVGVFSLEHEQLVTGIASQAAIAIENARLYEDRARTAQTLQQALLPSQLPQLADVQIATSYRAAGEGVAIGGDFYDVFELGDGSWAVVVGDVSGKGAPAAATTALARPGGPRGAIMDVTFQLTASVDAAHELATALRPLEPRLGGELLADLRLLATELVANAVRHNVSRGGPIKFHVRSGEDVVRMSVESDGAEFELPSRPIPTPEGPGGWGLYLVDQRAERWRLDTVDGTRVWAEFAVS